MSRKDTCVLAAVASLAILLAVPSTGLADLAPYSQDFESMDQGDLSALGNDGWLAYGNVFGPDWAYWYGYGAFPAPNDPSAPAFSLVAAGEGGPDQGAQQLVVLSDYNNGDHGNGAWVEANVYQEMVVGAADVGSTWTFVFDVKHGDLDLQSTALAFIKTLDPSAGWAMTNFLTVDTTPLPDTWGTHSISISIDPALEGQILQIGFANTATAYEPSGMFYDNINFTPEPTSLVLVGAGAWVLLRRRR